MLSDVMDSMSGLEGRKAVLFFSEGFFSDNLPRELERVAAAAARSYSVFYAFDLNDRGVSFSATQPQGGQQQAEIQSRMESLGSLASQTDGQLVDRRAEPTSTRRSNRIADQSRDYYIVAFQPPPRTATSGQDYHLVKVRVSRPGVQVSTRTGYALKDPISAADRRHAIDLALRAPFPQQAVPLEATTYVLRGPGPGLARVILSLRADLPVAGRQAGAADVVFVAKSARDGHVAASGTGTIPLPLRPDDGRTTAETGYQVQFDAPPGDYLMRVVVREPGGTTGSVDRRFTVRNFDGTDLAASDLVLGRTVEGGLPVRPLGYTDSGLAGVFEIYARRAADLRSVDVQVNVTPVDSTTPVLSVRPELLAVQPTESGVSRGVQRVAAAGGAGLRRLSGQRGRPVARRDGRAAHARDRRRARGRAADRAAVAGAAQRGGDPRRRSGAALHRVAAERQRGPGNRGGGGVGSPRRVGGGASAARTARRRSSGGLPCAPGAGVVRGRAVR